MLCCSEASEEPRRLSASGAPPPPPPARRFVSILGGALLSLRQLYGQTSSFLLAPLPVKSVASRQRGLTFTQGDGESEGEFVRGKTDVRSSKQEALTTRRHYFARALAADRHIFSTLHCVCVCVFWYLSGSDGSFNLSHRPPSSTIKADWGVCWKRECVCGGEEPLKGNFL